MKEFQSLSLPSAKVESSESEPLGLIFSENCSYEDWEKTGQILNSIEKSVLWLIGDWFLSGSEKFNKNIGEDSVLLKFEYQTISRAARVCAAFPISRRRELPSWSHYQELEPLSFDEREKWFALSVEHNLTIRELRFSIRAGKVLKQNEIDKLSGKNLPTTNLESLSLKFRMFVRAANTEQEIDHRPIEWWEYIERQLRPMAELHRQAVCKLQPAELTQIEAENVQN